MKLELLIVIAVAFLASVEAQTRASQYFECPPGEVIWRVYATFHRGRRSGYDRDYRWYCRELAMYNAGQCRWTGYVNGWQRGFTYSCPSGRFLTGVSSSFRYRRIGKGDRRFRFKCCSAAGVTLSGCSQHGFVNGHRGTLNYRVPANRILYGWRNAYVRRWHDRRWAPRTCAFTVGS